MVKLPTFNRTTAGSVPAGGTNNNVMGKTIRKSKTGEKYRDGKPKSFKCKCDYCINPKRKQGISIKEDLKIDNDHKYYFKNIAA